MMKSVSALTLLVAIIIAFDINIVVDVDAVVKTNNSLVRNKRNLAPVVVAEAEGGGYYGTTKASKSSKKKSKGGYYGTDNPTSGDYTSKKSKSKSDKSCKSKSAKKSTEEG